MGREDVAHIIVHQNPQAGFASSGSVFSKVWGGAPSGAQSSSGLVWKEEKGR